MPGTVTRAAMLGASAALAITLGTAQAQTTGPEGFGDFVWDDLNFNGIQDPGEPGMPAVTVNLYRSDDFASPFTSDVTNASGIYFLNIGTGAISFNWQVQFIRPGGFNFSPADVGANDAIDSDVTDALTGRTAIIPGSAFPGPSNRAPILTVDAGLFATTQVPEPGTLALIGATIIALLGGARMRRWRRRR